MKKRNKIAMLIRKNKVVISVGLCMLLFPLVIDAIYHIPIDWFYIKEKDLLSFYGVVISVFGSFVTYRNEKKKETLSRNQELKPYIAVELKLAGESGYFKLKLKKLKDNLITDIFIFDVPIDISLKTENSYSINFYSENEKNQTIDLSEYEDEIIDSDGYPKYLLLSCCDSENRMWQGEYIKLLNGNEKIYVLKDMYLV